MKQINLTSKYRCPANILAIIVNAIFMLAAPPSDFGDCFFKLIECLALIKVVIASWKWRNSNNVFTALHLGNTQIKKQTLE